MYISLSTIQAFTDGVPTYHLFLWFCLYLQCPFSKVVNVSILL